MNLLKLCVIAAIAVLPKAGIAEMSQNDILLGYQEHAALAQFYRWYQVYERPAGGLDNALDILTTDATVVSGLGTANGHAEYKARVSQLPDTWKNAHHVRSTDIRHSEDGSIMLTADVVYQNQGILPDGALRGAELTYTVSLVPGDTVLPLLSRVEIAQDSEIQVENFEDAYAKNRMLSLVHYWLALIEDPSRNPEPVKEILANGFSLNFSSGTITEFAGLEAWLAGPGSQVAASTHVLSNFSTVVNGDGTFGMSVDFDWAGVMPDGTELIAKTRHQWTATNDVTERFARIKTMDVEVLEPFRPK